MAEVNPNWRDSVTMRFTHPCVHRAAETAGRAICVLASNEIGEGNGVDSTHCANCQLHGPTPRREFTDAWIMSLHFNWLNRIHENFVQDHALIEESIRKAAIFLKASSTYQRSWETQQKFRDRVETEQAKFDNMLDALVELGRIPAERVLRAMKESQ